MKLWVLRDLETYITLSKEPDESCAQWAVTDHVFPDNMVNAFCVGEFQKYTGVKLKPGQFCQIEVKQVGDTYYYS